MTRIAVTGFTIAALVVFSDQATKALIRYNLNPGELLPVTSFFNLSHHYNRGAAFGMFADNGANGILLALGLFAIVLFIVFALRSGDDRWGAAAWAMMLGGAVGNVIDRIRFGAVADWLDFHAAGWHWPAFNIADAALTVGVGLYFLGDLRRRHHERAAA